MSKDERWVKFACAALTGTVMGNFNGDTDQAAERADRMMVQFDKRFPPKVPARPEPTSIPSGGIKRTDR